MSSSVFAKSPVSTNESRIDSNLVVVFGKNGINVDRKGLENLVDEKSLSTISVIRLTSPTPSMEEQVDKENDQVQNRKLKKNNKNSDDDDNENKDNTEIDEDENYEDEDNDDDPEDDDDEEEDELLATLKGKKFKKREKPEIVGLTVENFYLPDEAKQIAKQILNVSGVNPLFINIDYDVQRRAIENDHCYTPLLSPSQLNDNKLSETKTIVSQIPSTSKQSQQKLTTKNTKPRKITKSGGSSTDTDDKRESIDEQSFRMENKQPNDTEDDFEDDDSEYEIESLDTDNDRDSDLDFSVYDRNGRKQRKTSLKKTSTTKRLSTMIKVPKKRQSSYTDSQDIDDKKSSQQTVRANRLSSESKSSIKSPIPAGHQQNVTPTEPALISLQQPSPAKYSIPILSKIKTTLPVPISKQINMDKTIDRQLILPTIKNQLVKLATGDQSGKAIVQNVVIIKQPHHKTEGQSTGGGSFTDISKYLTKVELNQTNVKVSELVKSDNKNTAIIVSRTAAVPRTSISGNVQQQQQVKTIKRGFMPLEVGSVNKNQLPSQISIQTHQSSSELLAAENDKQLDLIDSIVKDEMKKSNIIDNELIKKNVNIPKLVKMLESTENTMYTQQQQIPSVSNTQISTFRNAVEDIDIANAPLLDTPTDDIPEDLLKDVAELIDNKTLQEFVEKHSLIDQQQQQALQSISTSTTDFETNIPPANISVHNQEALNSSHVTSENKTIVSLNNSQTVNTPVRNEPIQIMQRNGKVITLPPIEAPTTRAKRRAAANTSISGTSANKLEINEATAGTTPQNEQKQSGISAVGIGNDKVGTSSRRGSKEQTKSASIKKKRASTSSAQNNAKDIDGDTSQEEEDDDDPKKLWCICRQPHNNRFMICCDICEDWFHGACVNVTKAMGLEMEQKGIEWTCPKCLKTKKPIQRKITEIFDKKPLKSGQQKKSFGGNAGGQQTKKIQQSHQKLPISDTKKQQLIKRQSTDSSSGTGSGNNTPKLIQKQLFDLSANKQSKTETPKKNIIITTAITIPNTTPNINPNTNPTLDLPDQQNIKQDLSSSGLNTPKTTQATTAKADETLNYCIVCKKLARVNSIYCSDDCIRKHASNALVTKVSKVSITPTGSPTAPGDVDKKKKTPSSFEEALAIASHLQPKKVERVYVYERKSGRLLTGNNAPTTLNLKKWLQDNPTFEVVQPGSPQAIAIEKNKQKSRSQSNSLSDMPTATTVSSPSPSPVQIQQPQQSQQPSIIKVVRQPTPTTTGKLNKLELTNITKDTSSSNSPKHLQKYPQQVKIRPDKQETTKSIKKTTSTAVEKDQNSTGKDSKETAKKNTTQSEPIRLNVKRTLKEQLTLRMNELKETDENALLLTTSEIEKFAIKTEEEMFKLFNKDTGYKYKAKYRSLSFNLKDRKNKTLFKKICEKLVEPHQLVKMSPEELASQELAQWRQNENKHQLEMIKKSELDLLSCAKNYVLKTHKGEEVIESKTTDRLNLDISIPVEDVVTVLNNSTVSSTSELERTISPVKDPYKMISLFENNYDNDSITYTSTSTSGLNVIPKTISETTSTTTTTTSITSASTINKSGSSSDKKKSTSKDRDREHRDKRHKNKDHHKEKSRKRSRSRSRSRERTKHNKSPYKEDKKEHEKRKESKYHESSSKTTSSTKTTTTTTTVTKQSNIKTGDKVHKTKDERTETPPQIYSLIDEILDSTKTVEEAANLKVSDNDRKQPLTSTSVVSSIEVKGTDRHQASEQRKLDNDSDQEPSSTVVITTPPPQEDEEDDIYSTSDLDAVLWTGSINMIDVATFAISIHPVSGIYIDIDKYLPNELDVVGRISPDTVWDYISKIKKSPNKEVVIIRLVPSSETENIAYSSLYMYLDKRKRLGVVKTISPAIKDFYIVPLGSRKLLPSVLQPVTNPSFFEDELRPDLLLGVVIRIMPTGGLVGIKRPHLNTNTSGMPAQKVKRQTETSVILKKSMSSIITLEDDEEHYTPPGTPPSISARNSKSKLSHRFSSSKSSAGKIVNQTSREKTESTFFAKDDDADEPYSPGGSSGDDDIIAVLSTTQSTRHSVPASSNSVDQDELKRKMEEINRQIEAQQQEIAGMLGTDAYSPSDSTLTAPTLAPALANISIPSNLQQILASIQSKPTTESKTPFTIGTHGIDDHGTSSREEPYKPNVSTSNSRLAQLTEAELLSMVPDDIEINQKNPEPIKSISTQSSVPSPTKRARWDVEPPPPGLEDEFD